VISGRLLVDQRIELGGTIVVVPGTAGQILAIVLLILPGFVFTAVRRRLQGPAPADGDFAQRLLTAIVVGAVMDALYVLVGGRHLTTILADRNSWQQHPRQAVLLGLALLLAAPVILAVLDDRRRGGRFDIPLRG
jgi:hypothetical protein